MSGVLLNFEVAKNIWLLVLISTFYLGLGSVQAINCTDRCNSGDECQSVINECSKRLDELNKAKDTLNNQIKIIDSQVGLTLLKIDQTQAAVSLLIKEIDSLSQKIESLDIYLNKLSAVFIKLVNQSYKTSKISPLFSFLFSNNLDSFLRQHRYVTSLQQEVRQNLLEFETTRTNFDIQKEQKKLKQNELETLEKRLKEQKQSLASQKTSKTNLLEVTKNDEKRYQSLKKAAEDELSSLLTAKLDKVFSVKQGQAIGLMGNTGYSFGDHLHFGLYNLSEGNIKSWTYFNDIDPTDYLKQHRWPMNDPITITQSRGVTKYSYLYSDKFHHGIDIVANNKVVVAVNDGVAYVYRNSGSSLGNHVKVFHPDGKMSLYLHLQ